MKYTFVYLASGSPRTQEILTQFGVDFEILAVDVDEIYFTQEMSQQYVQCVATEKAQAGREQLSHIGRLPVVCADISVIVNDQVLGKPTSLDNVRDMLQKLSGQTHQVMTAVTDNGASGFLNTSSVLFVALTDDEIDWYLPTKKGEDEAESYAVQGLAARFITYIAGSYSEIMGLPLREMTILQDTAGE